MAGNNKSEKSAANNHGKRGNSQRRDCCGQIGVIAALGVAEASWIWTTKMHAAEGVGKKEDGCIF